MHGKESEFKKSYGGSTSANHLVSPISKSAWASGGSRSETRTERQHSNCKDFGHFSPQCPQRSVVFSDKGTFIDYTTPETEKNKLLGWKLKRKSRWQELLP